MPELIIGLISGTSADGVDSVLAEFDAGHFPRILNQHFHPYPGELRQRIIAIAHSESMEFDDYFNVDNAIAEEFAEATNELLSLDQYSPAAITVVGCHGQTIRHKPGPDSPYTVQLGNPNIIAAKTGIDVVADFRRADMAQGGQGAPLAPLFHDQVLRVTGKNTAVLNLGGIANISILKDGEPVFGFDTGPANALMDFWIHHIHGLDYDEKGQWAATGQVDNELLHVMLSDQYFKISPPKSTGREYFSKNWLLEKLQDRDINPADVQATLCALSCQSICQSLKIYCEPCDLLYVCGGGVENQELIRRLKHKLHPTKVLNTIEMGLDPDYLEAVLIAWLAYLRMNKRPLSMKSVTGGPERVFFGLPLQSRLIDSSAVEKLPLKQRQL